MRIPYPMPLPKWSDLINALTNSNTLDKCKDEILTFNSGYSIFSIASLRSAYLTKQINIFIPIFFCNQSLSLLRKNPLFKLIFYKINEDLTANIESIQKISSKYQPDIILGVHYFGSILDLTPLANFAKTCGAWLIEDCVHIFSKEGIPDYCGDFIITSPHKHFAIPGGACIKVLSMGPSAFGLKTQEINNQLFSLSMPYSQNEKLLLTFFCLRWFVKRALQKCVAFNLTRNKTSTDEYSEKKFHHINKFISNLLKISKKRRLHLSEAKMKVHNFWLESIEALLPYKNIKVKECNLIPYYLSFTSDSDINKIYKDLCNAMWPVSYWPDLPPEAYGNNDFGHQAIEIKNKLLHLPNHFDITSKQVFNCYQKYFSEISKTWRVKELEESEWIHYCKLTNLNYLQAWTYGEIKKLTSIFIKVRRLLILDQDNIPVSIAQVIGIKLFFLPTIYQLNRGPLLIHDRHPNLKQLSLQLVSIASIKRHLANNWSILYRICPEIKSSEFADYGMKLLGYKRANISSWASGIVFLTSSEAEIMHKLLPKWRNSLKKGLSTHQVVRKHDSHSQVFEFFLNAYENHKKNVGYSGIPTFDIKSIATFHSKNWSVNLFASYKGDDAYQVNPIGFLLSLGVGDTVTYLASVTTDLGKSMQSNSVLLWHSICDAKNNGYLFFDIGGLNQSTPPGIAHFKSGLNSSRYENAGVWRLF